MEVDGVGPIRNQRVRKTCAACHRRKIRCDKTIPCSACTRRGISHLCSREENSSSRSIQARQPVDDGKIRALLDRVTQLETQLQSHDTPERNPISTDTPERAAETEPSLDPDGEEIDAPTVLEFLAWGRRKDNDFTTVPEHGREPDSEGNLQVTNVLGESTKRAQFDMLEAVLPSRNHIKAMVDYHNTSLLWYHGSYSSKIFSDDLDNFLSEKGGSVRYDKLNLQWLALLFAILTGSITCASKSTSRAWGFSEPEKPTLGNQWYRAAITCLNMANYVENHSIHAVQAIATLTIAAHSLGHSNSQSVLLASAGRIAQSLGLHRLGTEPPTTSKEHLRRREAGRRVFNQLCTQDWFSIPFSESYALNPRFSTTVKPLNCNDDDLVVQPLSTPTQASYYNYRYDIAALMPQLLDDMANCNTPFTKYEQVLKYDEKMRRLATTSIPTFLSTNAPVDAEWPAYVGWARRSLTICAAHKIIMIHRKFVALSFTNTAFDFTRRTCLAAAKTILKEALAVPDENGPVLWIDQAFAVAAAIVLSLDTFHRKPSEKEYREHIQLVTDTVHYLREFEHSKIALRGVHLLSSLQSKLGSSTISHSADSPSLDSSSKQPQTFQMQAFIQEVSQNLASPASAASTTPEPTDTGPDNPWDAFLGLLSQQNGFNSQYIFDDSSIFPF